LYSHWIILGGSSDIAKNISVCWSEMKHDLLTTCEVNMARY